MKSTIQIGKSLRAGLVIIFANLCALPLWAGGNGTPTDEEIDNIRKKFLGLERPINYELALNDGEATIKLSGETERFATSVSTEALVYALWRYTDDPVYEAEAVIILDGRLKGSIDSERGGVDFLTYKSVKEPGNWPRASKALIYLCRMDCRAVLGKKYDDNWYPHQVLFDRETVLAESKTNAAVRAAYVAAMQKALADPTLRVENPLETDNILLLLYILDKKAAVSNFVDYIFYDSGSKGNFRRKNEHLQGNAIRTDGKTAGLAYLGSMGDEFLPLVLERFSKVTPEERSVSVGGGATPMHAIDYFFSIRYTEEQALKAIESFKSGNPNLTKEQIAALDEISDAIRTKKHRPDYFRMHVSGRPDWSAPVSTNSLPHQ